MCSRSSKFPEIETQLPNNTSFSVSLLKVNMAPPIEPTIIKIDVDHKENADGREPVAKAVEIRSRALAAALAQEQPRPFRKSFLRLYLCLAVAYMCSSTNGFDANTFGKRPLLHSEFSLTNKVAYPLRKTLQHTST